MHRCRKEYRNLLGRVRIITLTRLSIVAVLQLSPNRVDCEHTSGWGFFGKSARAPQFKASATEGLKQASRDQKRQEPEGKFFNEPIHASLATPLSSGYQRQALAAKLPHAPNIPMRSRHETKPDDDQAQHGV